MPLLAQMARIQQAPMNLLPAAEAINNMSANMVEFLTLGVHGCKGPVGTAPVRIEKARCIPLRTARMKSKMNCMQSSFVYHAGT